MNDAPLLRIGVDLVGGRFEALVTPEDNVVRAAGFVGPAERVGPTELVGLAERVEPTEQVGLAGPARPAGGEQQPDTLEQQLYARAPVLSQRGVHLDAIATGPVAAALLAYANGHLEALSEIAVSQPAPPFRGDVWRALREVPPGAPVTYAELAAQAGRPAAIRAAASACASNLIPLIVPCHRVVRSDGSLGGYLFGTALKRRLLEHEATHAATHAAASRRH